MSNNKTFTLVLIAICTILANIIFFSLFSSPGTELESTAATPIELKEDQPGANPENTLESIDFYDDVNQRPLFNSNRKPEEFVEDEQKPVENTPRPGPRPDLTLVGIVLADQEQIALVRSRKSPKIQRIKLDEDIDGWKLAELDSNLALFRSGNRELTLELNRRGDPKKASQLKKRKVGKSPSEIRNQPALNNIPPMGEPLLDEDLEMEMSFDEEEFDGDE